MLEAIIAAIIFAGVTVALMGVWDMQFDAMLKSKETAVASFLAERLMEECVAAGFNEAELLYPSPGTVQVRSRTKGGENIADYDFEVIVVDHPTDSRQELVTVRVTFTDSTGTHDVTYHTALNEFG